MRVRANHENPIGLRVLLSGGDMEMPLMRTLPWRVDLCDRLDKIPATGTR